MFEVPLLLELDVLSGRKLELAPLAAELALARLRVPRTPPPRVPLEEAGGPPNLRLSSSSSRLR